MELYKGVRQIAVKPEVINQIYANKYLTTSIDERIFDKRLRFPVQNEYIHLQSTVSNQSAIARVKGEALVLVNGKDYCISNVKPRNLHQRMAFDALMDDSIQVMVITGRAGTGKTLLALATALAKLDEGKYRRLILTKPMSQVGKHPIGILPGEIHDKFNPYLDNYMDNIEHLLNGRHGSVGDLVHHYRMDFKPIQLIRGASWQETFIIADEMQVLDYHEMVTLGTRVGEGSKIVIMGDMGQRDERIQVDKTGMHKFVNDKRVQECTFSASIELEKVERGPVAELFATVFEV